MSTKNLTLEDDGDNETGYYTGFLILNLIMMNILTMIHKKYSEELEYEDSGEPATFNFNIHSGERSTPLDFFARNRIFSDQQGRRPRSLVDAHGMQVLLIWAQRVIQSFQLNFIRQGC